MDCGVYHLKKQRGKFSRKNCPYRDPSVSPDFPLASGADEINKLPNEILLKIFGYLNSNFVVKNISEVSQRFEMLSKDPNLLTNFVCEKCGKRFSQMDNLKEHFKYFHEGQNEGRRCEKCNKKFKRPIDLKQHKKAVHERR